MKLCPHPVVLENISASG